MNSIESLEERIKELEERLDLSFMNSKDANFLADAETGIIIDCNISGEKLLERKREEIIGKSYKILHPPEFNEKYSNILKDHVEKNSIESEQLEIITSSGEIKIVDVKANVSKVKNKKVVQGVFRDVTEQKKLGEKVKSSEERFKSYILNSPNSIFITNDKSEYTYINPSASKLLGYTLEEISNLTIKDVQSEDCLNEGFEQFSKLKESGKVLDFHTKLKRKDNSLVDVILDYVKISESEYVAFVKDISQIKRYEKKIVNAKNKAEELNELKETFIRNMTHEFRTPLNGIVGVSEMLLDSNLSENDRELVKMICDSGKNLDHMVNDILNFSRIKSGKEKINMSLFDLNKLLTDSVTFFTPQAKILNNNLDLNYSSSLDKDYIGDEYKIKNIVNHLLGNALKFTKSGDVKISAYPKNIKEYSLDLIIDFEDTGVGINLDKIDLIFEPFYQVNGEMSRNFNGVGIGLSVSKNFAEIMGGGISVESIFNKGSCFKLKVPLEICKKDVSHELYGSNTKKVLVVDDVLINRKILEKMLDKINYKHDSLEDGSKVLNYLENNQDCSLILMDCMMPIMDGYQATKVIRAWEKNSNKSKISIIAVTAAFGEDEKQKCLDCGMNDYMPKPINALKLTEMIGKWSHYNS